MAVEFEAGEPLGLEDVQMIKRSLESLESNETLNNVDQRDCTNLIAKCDEALEEMG